MTETLEQMLERHEGCRLKAYTDTEGILTIGIGHNLNKPITRRAALLIFEDDILDAQDDCTRAFPWFTDLDTARQAVLINMCFNLGLPRLQGFVKFLKAMEVGDYETAAKEMLDSKWAKQVKGRAIELAQLIRGSAEA